MSSQDFHKTSIYKNNIFNLYYMHIQTHMLHFGITFMEHKRVRIIPNSEYKTKPYMAQTN